MDPSDEIIKLKFTKPDARKSILNVHRGILCQSSDFFQNALKPEWAALREEPDVIELSDDFETVSHYIRWLYSGEISIRLCDVGGLTRERIAEEAEKVLVTLAEAYVFGEKIVDTKYKTSVMSMWLNTREDFGHIPSSYCVDIIYKGTPSKSPLRRLIAEKAAYVASHSRKVKGWSDFFDECSREVLADILKAMMKVQTMPRYEFISRCHSYLRGEEKK